MPEKPAIDVLWDIASEVFPTQAVSDAPYAFEILDSLTSTDETEWQNTVAVLIQERVPDVDTPDCEWQDFLDSLIVGYGQACVFNLVATTVTGMVLSNRPEAALFFVGHVLDWVRFNEFERGEIFMELLLGMVTSSSGNKQEAVDILSSVVMTANAMEMPLTAALAMTTIDQINPPKIASYFAQTETTT